MNRREFLNGTAVAGVALLADLAWGQTPGGAQGNLAKDPRLKAISPSEMKAAYLRALPELSKPHAQLFSSRVSALQAFSARFDQPLKEAAKSSGLDLQKLQTEIRQIMAIQDSAKRSVETKKFAAQYGPAMADVRSRAGVTKAIPQLAGKLMAGKGETVLDAPGGGLMINPSATIHLAPYKPRDEHAGPDASRGQTYTDFPNQGGSEGVALDGHGHFEVNNRAEVAGSSQKTAFYGVRIHVPAGMTEIRVQATLGRVYASTTVAVVAGYGSAEALIGLRILDESNKPLMEEFNGRQPAEDRRSLHRTVCAVIGVDTQADPDERGRTYVLTTRHRRDATHDSYYQLVVNAEVWAGVGGLGGAISNIKGTVESIETTYIV